MKILSNIESFVRSAENGSFSAAARLLGLTPAAVSKNVAKLESNLGVRLFQRSTRSLTLTEAGERFFADAAIGLAFLQTAMSNQATSDGVPTGTLKVSLAPTFGRDYVLPLLGNFLGRFPNVIPDWHFDYRQVDLIKEGFDAAIGGGFEMTPGVVARELARLHLVPVATPDFLAACPSIAAPHDLLALDGVLWRSPKTGRVRPWLLQGPQGDQVSLELKPRVTMSDPEALCGGVLMGLGIGLIGMPHALPHLKNGALVRVLPDWYSDAGVISLYYAGRKLLPAKTRAFVDFLVATFRDHDIARQLRADQ